MTYLYEKNLDKNENLWKNVVVHFTYEHNTNKEFLSCSSRRHQSSYIFINGIFIRKKKKHLDEKIEYFEKKRSCKCYLCT